MSNKKLYKDTFDKISMSEEACRRVRNLDVPEEKKERCGWKYAAAVLAALAILFVSGNTISYAATGNALVDVTKYVGKVSVFINGKKAAESNVKKYTDEDGNETLEINLGGDEQGGSVYITSDTENLEEKNISVDTDIDTQGKEAQVSIAIMDGKVVKNGDKVFLMIGDDEKKIDITEDFSDGKAKGEFTLDNKQYQYSVSGTVKENDIEIQRMQ